jgi:hypothetical protein
MSAPALVYLALTFVLTVLVVLSNAKAKRGMIVFHFTLVAIELGLLYWGGFFASVPA